MYHFVYKTINPLTKEYYIGKHTTINLFDNYQGSGTWIDYCKRKNINLITGIIDFCKNENTVLKLEEEIIEQNINDSLCKNIAYGGVGFKSGHKNPNYSIKRDDSFKKNISLKNSGKNHGMWGKKQTDYQKRRMKEIHTNKIVSLETRKKQSEAAKGRIVSDETRKKISDFVKNNHPFKGKKRPEHSKKIKLYWIKKKGLINAR
jgi:hypothetical protein